MSASYSLPLFSFPSGGDTEVIPTKEIPDSNPAFLGDVTGVEANHSSLVSSVANGDGDTAQFNDDELGNPSQGYLDPQGSDPNMSGPSASQEVQERLAGGMSGMNGGLLPMDSAEEYHSWATFSGSAEAFGSDSCSPQGDFGSSNGSVAGITVFPIIRRA